MFSKRKEVAAREAFHERWSEHASYDEHGQLRLPAYLIDRYLDEASRISSDIRGGEFIVESIETHDDIPTLTPILKTSVPETITQTESDESKATVAKVHAIVKEIGPETSARELALSLADLANSTSR